MPTSESTRRWYHLTPGRLILALLVVECLLWLSERFQWFSFNQHKGWTVLIAVASVGVAMLLMLLWFLASLLYRWRFQFSIRSLLVLTVAVAILCSWLAVEMQKARRQREVVEAIKNLEGSVAYDYQFWKGPGPSPEFPPGYSPCPPVPAWLRKLLGDDFFANVVLVNLDRTKVMDAGLENLKGLTQLKWLKLDHTQITDAGLDHLKGLTQLELLGLEHTQVTDAGLENLKGMTTLTRLSFYNTQVTDEGMRKLQQALPKCWISR